MPGYITLYSRTDSKRNFDDDIVSELYQNALDDCFDLVEKGYNAYLIDSEKVFSADETIITAGICGHIESIIAKYRLPFDIVPEYFVYSEKIKKGKLMPKKAKRFDLRILTWNAKNETIKFGVEAKILADKNFKSKIALNLIKEYVQDAGMGKFINKIYDQSTYNDGFMLGYILNGGIENILRKINDRITITYSENEHLTNNKKHFISSYLDNGKQKILYHILLDFSVLVN